MLNTTQILQKYYCIILLLLIKLFYEFYVNCKVCGSVRSIIYAKV